MRVGIFLRYPFHEKIFRSTITALNGVHDYTITAEAKELMKYRPHVVLAAEDITYLHLRGHLPKSLFIHTRHGLASKGIPARSFRAADYVCVTSNFIRDEFIQRGIRPRREYWPVGYIQMDNLLSSPRPAEVPPGRRVILYAPTWHHGLSSLPMLSDQVLQLLRPPRDDTLLVIKPHPLVQEGADPVVAPWMERLRRLCHGHSNIHLIEDRSTDVMPWLNAADLLITDASSVQLEFLALNRPIILINNPERFQSPHFDPQGYEWSWRDMGEAVDSVDQLPAAIARALDKPKIGESVRLRYRDRLFGPTADGRAGERLVGKIGMLEESVSSEASLLAVSPFGHVFSSCLPYLRTISYAFRRMRST